MYLNILIYPSSYVQSASTSRSDLQGRKNGGRVQDQERDPANNSGLSECNGETPIIQAELLACRIHVAFAFRFQHTAIPQLSDGDTSNIQTTYSPTNTYSSQCLLNFFPWTLITTKPLLIYQATQFPLSNMGSGLDYYQYPPPPSFETVCC